MRNRELLDVYGMQLDEYSGLLTCVNENYLRSTRRVLAPMCTELDRLCPYSLITVGSDGKKERHPQSKTEIVYVFEKQEMAPRAQDIAQIFRRTTGNTYFYETSEGQPMVVCLDQETPLSYAFNNSRLVYPDRVLNSVLVLGDENIHLKSRLKVLEEMIGPESGKIRREMRQQRNEYGKACRTATYRAVSLFDPDTGVQYYDEDRKSYALGFKTSFLRLMQRTLDLLVNDGIKKYGINIRQIKEMPTSTVDRIKYLQKIGWIESGNQEVAAAQESYLWFLREYHKAQEAYKNRGSGVNVPYNLSEFHKHRLSMFGFVSETTDYRLT